jgi:3-phytase
MRFITSNAWSPALLLILACGAPTTPITVRIATFNASLFRDTAGGLIADLSTPRNPQGKVVAEIIQRSRPDVLLINEFDYDSLAAAVRLFQEHYLGIAQNVSSSTSASAPIQFPFRFLAPVNTGVPSGMDLDNDGTIGVRDNAYAGDALGFGRFPGQYGMLVLSRFPIDTSRVRTFRTFRWIDMPGAMLPSDPTTGRAWYSDSELEIFPLSSKSHWDLPITIGDRVLHILASHPTPPVFDGPEDRNGRRNHDEIRFWADYVTLGADGYIYDDRGGGGGLDEAASFAILGDMNADPHDGDSTSQPILLLLGNPRINAVVTPASEGAVEQAEHQGGANRAHRGDPAFDTADFNDRGNGPGNLRLDYVLPSSDLTIESAGVFWPRSDNSLFAIVGTFPFPASDHRLVWIDVRW